VKKFAPFLKWLPKRRVNRMICIIMQVFVSRKPNGAHILVEIPWPDANLIEHQAHPSLAVQEKFQPWQEDFKQGPERPIDMLTRGNAPVGRRRKRRRNRG
jgi:hypothetical protein